MATDTVSPAEQLALDFRRDPGATLSSFVARDNEQVVAQIAALAAPPRPFFYLSGAPGSGKSHLMQAACDVVSRQGGAAAYVPLADFSDHSAQCLEGLEKLDLVALDGLELIAGNAAWEEAIFHCFNRLQDSAGALLVAASGTPESVGIGLPDLVSRLQSVLRYRLRPPDDARRREILGHQAKLRGLTLPAASMDYLLRREVRTLGNLITTLDRLDAASLQHGRRLTVPFIREILDA